MSEGVRRLAYRVRQLSSALAAPRAEVDDAAAGLVLPPPLLAPFRRLAPSDRRHALAVLAALQAEGFGSEADLPLLQASLLHDVGKADAGITLLHRVLRVLLTRPAPPVWRRLTASATDWRRPFWVLEHHAARGAVWVRSAGGSPDLVALVRCHDTPAPVEWAGTSLAIWHAALQAADGRA